MADYATFEDDMIVIRIPKTHLGGAAFQGLEQFEIDEDDVDWDVMAKDMTDELNAEEEDGTTLINRALDQALINAGENGSSALPE